MICTYDERRGGGKRLVYKDVMLTIAQPAGEKNTEGNGAGRKPNFKATATTNIRCVNGDTVTIHPCLIESFNGKRVVI